MAILDDESLLAACAHIDLSAVAAEIAEVPQASPYSSIKKTRGTCEGPASQRRFEGGEGRPEGGLEGVGETGRFTVALPDRRPTEVGVFT